MGVGASKGHVLETSQRVVLYSHGQHLRQNLPLGGTMVLFPIDEELVDFNPGFKVKGVTDCIFCNFIFNYLEWTAGKALTLTTSRKISSNKALKKKRFVS